MNNQITNKISYVGVNDKDIDLFESQYKVKNGVSYNSYLIKDEKVVLLDTVDERKNEEWLSKIQEELQERKIDYLVISHLEPDHSANIDRITKLYPELTLIGNAKTFDMLPQFSSIDENIKKLVVKEKDILNIGEHTLQFFMAPMVHWPEVMLTYEQKEKILFSADSFGKFGALEDNNLFSNNKEKWLDEARRYYINIVGKYGMQVQMLLKKLSTLDIKMICPLHGPILNENLEYYINKYDIWSSYQKEEEGTLIAFASIHGNTKKAAIKMKYILNELGEKNIKIMDLARDDIHEAVADAFKYDKMILLASSYNMGVFPPMENFLNILKSKNYKNRKVAIVENGSWAPSAGKCMSNMLQEMNNIEIIDKIVTIKTRMIKDNEEQMQELAKNFLK